MPWLKFYIYVLVNQKKGLEKQDKYFTHRTSLHY